MLRRPIGAWLALVGAAWLAPAFSAAEPEPPRETVTVVDDDFQTGRFSPDWNATAGSDVRVVHQPGEAAGGGDYYARVEGVAAGQGGLGATFANLFRDPFATDFSIALDFRVGRTLANPWGQTGIRD